MMLSCFFATAQEAVLQQPMDWKGELRNMYPIKNEPSGKICFVFLTPRAIYAQLLNEAMQPEKTLSLETTEVQQQLGTIVGNFVNGDSYVLVGSPNAPGESYLYLNVNFATGKIEFNNRMKLSIPEDEEVLSSFSENRKFYVLSVFKRLPALRLRQVEKIGVPVMKAFDLPEVALSKKHKDLHGYLRKDDVDYNPFNKVPADPSGGSLSVSVARHKLYFQNEEIILTIDKISEGTNVLVLNLKEGKARFKQVNYPTLNCTVASEGDLKENSFLYQNYLFQIRTCPSGAAIHVADFTVGTVLKKFFFSGRDTIAFQNSPFVFRKAGRELDQVEPFYRFAVRMPSYEPFQKAKIKEQQLESTQKFMAKMLDYQPSIAARMNTNDQIEMIIGGQDAVELTGPVWGTGGGGPTMVGGSPGFSTPYGNVPASPGRMVYNPTYGIIRSTVGSNSVFFKSILNKQDLEHQDAEVTPQPYDQLQNDLKKQFDDKAFKAETIFYFNNAFYLSTYNKDTRQFLIYRY
jgi:hypothetical protein